MQLEQWSWSDCRSKHWPPQFVNPALHRMPQLTPMQVAVPFFGCGQVVPQPPQFRTSFEVRTQIPAQSVKPASQVTPHLDALQVGVPLSGFVQAALQPPQLAALVVISTQLASHSLCPRGQPEFVHLPPIHSSPAAHA